MRLTIWRPFVYPIYNIQQQHFCQYLVCFWTISDRSELFWKMSCSTLARPDLSRSSTTSIALLDQLIPYLQLNDVPLAHAGKVTHYLGNPCSLGASLAQLKRDMRSAIDEASRRMKKVQDLYRDIPEVTQEIENILIMGRTTCDGDMDSLISLMVGNHKECLKHTNSCTARFESVGKLIEEILELFTIRAGSFQKEIDNFESNMRSLVAMVSDKQREQNALYKRVSEAKELNKAREDVARTKSEKVHTIEKEVGLTALSGGLSFLTAIGAVVCPLLIPVAAASVAITGAQGFKTGVNIAEASDAHRSAKSDLNHATWKHEQCTKELAKITADLSQSQCDLKRSVEAKQSCSSNLYILGQCHSAVAQLKLNWGNMKRVFEIVADRVSETDGIRINQFTNTARALSGRGTSALKTRILRSQAELVRQSTGTSFEAMGRILEAFSFEESFNDRGSVLGKNARGSSSVCGGSVKGHGQGTRRSSSVYGGSVQGYGQDTRGSSSIERGSVQGYGQDTRGSSSIERGSVQGYGQDTRRSSSVYGGSVQGYGQDTRRSLSIERWLMQGHGQDTRRSSSVYGGSVQGYGQDTRRSLSIERWLLQGHGQDTRGSSSIERGSVQGYGQDTRRSSSVYGGSVQGYGQDTRRSSSVYGGSVQGHGQGTRRSSSVYGGSVQGYGQDTRRSSSIERWLMQGIGQDTRRSSSVYGGSVQGYGQDTRRSSSIERWLMQGHGQGTRRSSSVYGGSVQGYGQDTRRSSSIERWLMQGIGQDTRRSSSVYGGSVQGYGQDTRRSSSIERWLMQGHGQGTRRSSSVCGGSVQGYGQDTRGSSSVCGGSVIGHGQGTRRSSSVYGGSMLG